MMDEKNNSYQIIRSEAELKKVASTLEKESTIAVDLEADSMFHFKEKVCLLQIASPKENILVDPLEFSDFSSLKPVFSNPDIKKIFHGADYDVRSLHRDFDIDINNLFDTELASRFLGIKETGLDSVIKKRFDIDLDKKYQKKDWSQRPLPKSMLDYAAGDSVYLVPLYEILEKELKEKGRLAWVQEECELLSNVRSASLNGIPMFMKVKGSGRLSRRGLAVLENLLIFRREIAEKKDKPLFKIIGNNVLLKIAHTMPVSLRRLKRLKVLSPKQLNMFGLDLVILINDAFKLQEEELPIYPRKGKQRAIKSAVPRRGKVLKEWRDKKAEELDIDPSILFNKAMINSIAINNPIDLTSLKTINGIKNWQADAFGATVIEILKSVNRK